VHMVLPSWQAKHIPQLLIDPITVVDDGELHSPRVQHKELVQPRRSGVEAAAHAVET
jgi:hypothetical protein